jgi:hypothetical protein
MEHLDGKSPPSSSCGPAPLEQALDVVIQMAVADRHGNGVVHRDVAGERDTDERPSSSTSACHAGRLEPGHDPGGCAHLDRSATG